MLSAPAASAWASAWLGRLPPLVVNTEGGHATLLAQDPGPAQAVAALPGWCLRRVALDPPCIGMDAMGDVARRLDRVSAPPGALVGVELLLAAPQPPDDLRQRGAALHQAARQAGLLAGRGQEPLVQSAWVSDHDGPHRALLAAQGWGIGAVVLCAPGTSDTGRDFLLSARSTPMAREAAAITLERERTEIARVLADLGAVAAALGVRWGDMTAARCITRHPGLALRQAWHWLGSRSLMLDLVSGDAPEVLAGRLPGHHTLDVRAVTHEERA